MRMLVITQAVDIDHPVLGFFHGWLEEFATHADSIDVICLQKGRYSLPESVRVHSLGKEESRNRFAYILQFVRLVAVHSWRADAVFVHMNPEYIVIAGWFWRLLRKPVALWYNHEVVSVWFTMAMPFTQYVFHTSRFAGSSYVSRAHRMPAGINTKVFRPDASRVVQNSIYFQGRIAPAKRVHILLDAVEVLRASGTLATLTLVGPMDDEYVAMLKHDHKQLFATSVVRICGPVPNRNTPELYVAHAVSVNLTAAGNYDKTVLESAACGTPVIVGSHAFADVVPEKWVLDSVDAKHLAEKLKCALLLTNEQRIELGTKLRDSVCEQHSLNRLGIELFDILQSRRIL